MVVQLRCERSGRVDPTTGLCRELGHPPRRPRLADDMRPPLDRIVQSMVRPDPADGVVLDRLGVGDRAVEVEHERFDDGAGRAHASAATVASTRPSSECGSATAATVETRALGDARGDRSDRHHHRWNGGAAGTAEVTLDGRAGREGDGVRSGRRVEGLRVRGDRHRAVGHDGGDLPSLRPATPRRAPGGPPRPGRRARGRCDRPAPSGRRPPSPRRRSGPARARRGCRDERASPPCRARPRPTSARGPRRGPPAAETARSAPLGEVTTTQSHSPPSACRRASPPPIGSAMAKVGTSMTTAPSASSRARSRPACSGARAMTTRRPASLPPTSEASGADSPAGESGGLRRPLGRVRAGALVDPLVDAFRAGEERAHPQAVGLIDHRVRTDRERAP